MIDYKIFNVTDLATNCVYLIDKETGCNAVVDPGAKSDKLIEQINADGGKLTYVLLTHGHYDHITFAKQRVKQMQSFFPIQHLILPLSII